MDCEIEFLPVGDASKAGDAIVIRYGTPEAYELMIVDGGTAAAGEQLVEHIHTTFGTDAIISHVVLTHADADHACGLREVLTKLNVENFWLHLPWASAQAALPYFSDKRFTVAGLQQKLVKEYDLLAELVKIAVERDINVHYPFAGTAIGPFWVLSPSKAVYDILLPQFDRTPDPDKEAIETKGFWIGKAPSTLARIFDQAIARVQNWTEEKWDRERLRDGGITSASNESSVILYGDFGTGRRVLLTGDAGNWGLTMAAYYAETNGLPLQDFMFVQIPHHGSRRNVGPTILNRLLGPIVPEGTSPRFSAYVSAPKDDSSHPRKMVINAFKRRGARVYATQGRYQRFPGGFGARTGYTTSEPLPFFSRVEEYD